ncbi:HlyD family secretion protein [Alteromonas ponticola]|uniref:HlyD family efflux transporter periplasmic adaptor subunit n=1 Tax=Alteromonas ponticola TaxID=2720613 RepID=A0ABX1QZ54_9ALTE|nr:HlyD family efflux transporter periplasmic adaptor subunit [Alteromonas ponticola]NMH59124.1 HlyD family efflux transporter periplasmic adaptor subunit [Alteromonas ponticola]
MMNKLTDKAKLFRRQVMENQHRDAFGEVLVKHPREYAYFAWTMVFVVVLVLLLFFNASYTRYSNVFGVITADKGIVKVAARAEGEIIEQHVEEGQYVQKGELLYVISTARHSSNSQNLDAAMMQQQEALRASLEKDIQVARDAHKIQRASLDEKARGKQQELTQIEEQLAIYQSRVALSESSYKRNQALFKEGYINQSELDRNQEEHLSLLAKYSDLKAKYGTTATALSEINGQLQLAPKEFEEKINRLQRNVLENQQRLAEISTNVDYRIVSPVDGMIGTRLSHTGNPVNRGDALLTIIPSDSQLQAELYVPAQSIGFIQAGQDVSMRYSAFPYQQFGLQLGTVKSVAKVISLPEDIATSVSLTGAVYKVIVDLASQSVRVKDLDRAVQVGMELEASIALEQRSLVEWILEPLYSLKDK